MNTKVDESIISIIEENGRNKSPAPLLIFFDAAEVRKQAAASTQRTYIVTGDDGHYVAVIMEIENIGAKVIPNFAARLHFSGPVEKFLIDPITKKAIVKCEVSNKGCSSRPYSRARWRHGANCFLLVDIPKQEANDSTIVFFKDHVEEPLGLTKWPSYNTLFREQ
ncbi:hypothetical protein SESBI_45658 [Sesbania bispinosa]|nr:hypothetical protein SESBI_45658 [Sesbania bispinosa]